MTGQSVMIPVVGIQMHLSIFTGPENHIQKTPTLTENAAVITARKTPFLAREIKARETMKLRLIRHAQGIHRHIRTQTGPITRQAIAVRGEYIIKGLGHINEVLEVRPVILVPEHRGHTLILSELHQLVNRARRTQTDQT